MFLSNKPFPSGGNPYVCIPLPSGAWPVARGGGGEGGAGQPAADGCGPAAALLVGCVSARGRHRWCWLRQGPPAPAAAALPRCCCSGGMGKRVHGGLRGGPGCSAGRMHLQQTSSSSASAVVLRRLLEVACVAMALEMPLPWMLFQACWSHPAVGSCPASSRG